MAAGQRPVGALPVQRARLPAPIATARSPTPPRPRNLGPLPPAARHPAAHELPAADDHGGREPPGPPQTAGGQYPVLRVRPAPQTTQRKAVAPGPSVRPRPARRLFSE